MSGDGRASRAPRGALGRINATFVRPRWGGREESRRHRLGRALGRGHRGTQCSQARPKSSSAGAGDARLGMGSFWTEPRQLPGCGARSPRERARRVGSPGRWSLASQRDRTLQPTFGLKFWKLQRALQIECSFVAAGFGRFSLFSQVILKLRPAHDVVSTASRRFRRVESAITTIRTA